MSTCPFCGRDPFVYVDIGVGREAVAVDCCELGDLYFRGAREPITDDVAIDPDTFRELGARIAATQSELEAYKAKFGELDDEPALPTEALREALEECEEYFDQRADADQPAGCDSPIPNEEMTLLMKVREALSGAPLK